jgi:hypothetical protein
MGRIVTDKLQRARVFTGHDLYRAAGNRIGKIAHRAVYADRNRLLGERFGYRFGNFAACRAGCIIALGTIGKLQGNGLSHSNAPLSSPAYERGWLIFQPGNLRPGRRLFRPFEKLRQEALAKCR